MHQQNLARDSALKAMFVKEASDLFFRHLTHGVLTGNFWSTPTVFVVGRDQVI